jgi:hypothetical protein
MVLKYAAWNLEETSHGYKAHHPTEGITVSLNDGEFPWGWWPSEPVLTGSVTVVMGICFFDARWRVEFKNPKPGQKGAVRSLALPREREETEEFLKRGRKIERMVYSPFPTPYAQKIIEFQKWGLEKLGGMVERVLYHVPLNEYFSYASMLPSPWKERMKEVIKKEAELMADWVRHHLRDWPIEIHWGGESPPQSFVDLYIRASEESAKVIGLEELVELRLPFEAFRQTGRAIPTLVGVLGLPHPYFRPPEEEVIALEL